MFLQNIFQFLRGYVVLLLTGNSPERFINICIRRKIPLRNIQRKKNNQIILKMSCKDFLKIRPIAYKTRTRVHILKKCSLKNIVKKYKKRVFFAGGLLLVAMFFALSSQFLLNIEVVGCEEENKESILKAAELAGVKFGAFKHTLPEGNEIKNIILNNTDNLTWAWVYLKGTKAVIHVREGILPPLVIDKKTPCDVVALRDGIITDVTVKKGIAFCKKNDVVLKGDLLIGGTLGSEERGYILEHALGEIKAATWHTKKAQIKLFREVREKTGNKKKFCDVVLLSHPFKLYKNIDVPYREYSIKEKKHEIKAGNKIFAELKVNIYEEETVKKIPISEEQAVEAACYELEKEIAQTLLPGSVLVDKQISHTKTDEETLEVTLTMQFSEIIGGEVPLVLAKEEKQE